MTLAMFHGVIMNIDKVSSTFNEIFSIREIYIVTTLILFIVVICAFVLTLHPVISLLKKQLHIQNSYSAELESYMEVTEMLSKKADIADDTKSAFISNLSHEIRTPMNGIIGMTELISETNLDVTQQQYVDILKNSGSTLLTLIDDLFDFSKIGDGSLSIESIPFNLKLLIEDFSKLYAYRALDKGLTLQYIIDPNLPESIQGDPGRIRQILANLTGNAIKFTNDGNITITCRVLSIYDDEVKIFFGIEDSGVGIPDNIDIFEGFTQGDGSATRNSGGVGLGLTISKQLVGLMDGQIGIESNEIGGCHSWFKLKLKVTEKVNNRFINGDIKLARVLYVVNNKINRDVISAMLKNCGVNFNAVTSSEFLDSVLLNSYEIGEPYNIVLIDKSIEHNTEYFFCKSIKNNPIFKNIHIILLTSKIIRGEAKIFQDVGYSAYLTKPIKQIDLYDSISQIIGEIVNGRKETGRRIITRHSLNERRNALN